MHQCFKRHILDASKGEIRLRKILRFLSHIAEIELRGVRASIQIQRQEQSGHCSQPRQTQQ